MPQQTFFWAMAAMSALIFCTVVFAIPAQDNVIICPPTYGMYEVSANINDIEVRKAPLLDDFQLNLAHIETLIDDEH